MPIHNRPLTFPKTFTWGFAAAAPQIEGAAFADGKGESIWDRFACTPGKVHNGDSLDTACEHYTRYNEDFRLMRALGAKHYRLSIAWPRIYPNGDGAINQKGIDFYHRLFDSMEKHGLTPWVTMFHWDLPQSLETRFGGWRDRRTADAFAVYADTLVKTYGDRVKNWITLNEINCFTRMGYGGSNKAPGLSCTEQVVNQTYHTALLCHGHGVRAVREYGGRGTRVGLTDNSTVSVPHTDTPEDIAAARAHFILDNARTLDPIYTGGYGEAYRKAVGKNAAKFEKRDFDLISLPTDFLGMNIYSGNFVRAGKNNKPEQLAFPSTYPTADALWLKHVPQSLYWGPRHVSEVYGVKAVYITENGAGYNDLPPVKGEVNDLHRLNLVRFNLAELRRAIGDGIPVKGFFLWSFMDNFEWQDGYARRFGIVYCDYKTQKRTPKLSAHWYKKVMTENRIV
jgi:beta-glucosidase